MIYKLSTIFSAERNVYKTALSEVEVSSNEAVGVN
jgi:hypothetical protein